MAHGVSNRRRRVPVSLQRKFSDGIKKSCCLLRSAARHRRVPHIGQCVPSPHRLMTSGSALMLPLFPNNPGNESRMGKRPAPR